MDVETSTKGFLCLKNPKFLIYGGKQHPKIFGSVDVKISPDLSIGFRIICFFFHIWYVKKGTLKIKFVSFMSFITKSVTN